MVVLEIRLLYNECLDQKQDYDSNVLVLDLDFWQRHHAFPLSVLCFVEQNLVQNKLFSIKVVLIQ